MADAQYDALIIGGGCSGLIVANYLALYGGMRTAIFEARHELGGAWANEEVTPGFTACTHAAALSDYYTLPLERDFPLKEKGFEYLSYPAAKGAIFKEDHSSFCIYSAKTDPSGEATARQFGKFSARDADTWLWLWELFQEKVRPVIFQHLFNPLPPTGEPTRLNKLFQELCREESSRIDGSMAVKSELATLRDLFESEAIIAGLARLNHSATGLSPDAEGSGLMVLFRMPHMHTETGTWRGGTHSLAHIMSRIFVEAGGEFFTRSEVDKVIIENGQAQGIRLSDGSEIKASQLVVSTLDPVNLCFRLIGKEHLPERLARRVAHLERWRGTLSWYGWAVHELPDYRAAENEPDINKTGRIVMVSKDPELMVRNQAWRRLGKMPPELSLSAWGHSSIDNSQAPEGKHVLGCEEFVLPANRLSEQEWKEFKKKHAQDIIKEWQGFAPNMSWDNVISYLPLTPLDCTHASNYGPEGCNIILDCTPNQVRYRPTPELVHHRTPIKALYATGGGWHYGGGAWACSGYNCYKIISQDMSLTKPWQEKGWEF